MAKKYNLINGGKCKVEGCEKEAEKTGYCGMHYQRVRTTGKEGPPNRLINAVRGVCSVDGCGKMHDCNGYCSTHNNRIKMGLGVGTAELLRRKKGEGTISNGYHLIGINRKLKLAHRMIAERVLGYELPEKAVIHHVDGNRSNNENTNLVICENQKYHRMIHRRQEALVACGNANWLRCGVCKSYDDPNNLLVYPHGSSFRAYHRKCQSVLNKENRSKRARLNFSKRPNEPS